MIIRYILIVGVFIQTKYIQLFKDGQLLVFGMATASSHSSLEERCYSAHSHCVQLQLTLKVLDFFCCAFWGRKKRVYFLKSDTVLHGRYCECFRFASSRDLLGLQLTYSEGIFIIVYTPFPGNLIACGSAPFDR